MIPRLAPHRLAEDAQRVWIGFGGRADRLWMRLLRPGFRHCFAVLQDANGWTVVEPLSGRLLVARPVLPAEFDLPAFYRRAGLTLLGPSSPAPQPAQCFPRCLLIPAFPCAAHCWAARRRSR
ncbi:hypothetical protein [Teichococcus vastitatis]|uniref:Uncharacterized protein n=1 Tax=Teichococcus vastitatis TaxID=2307076 RepID=A0ABS9W0L2_9PROT|nr:hypothetical protein [Pseudoroseomonas vastitatis]MCI0752440.1 hypothetical protein [Pseudoroseomonas vastitatis]